MLYLFSYLLGSISPSVLISRFFYGKDIREHGSGNAGGTNTLRILGRLPGLIVFIVDLGKGSLACALPFLMGTNDSPWICGFLSVVGHIWPLFTGFRGGKGVATTAGMLMILAPKTFGVVFLIFIGMIILTRYVSLGSVLSCALAPFIAYGFRGFSMPETPILSALALIVIFTHRENLHRLYKGCESKLGQKPSSP